MKIVAVIPARYKSSRFPGKPLSDIHGKPMIWWVYQHYMMVPEFDEVYMATDDDRIQQTCMDLNMNVIMTSEDNQTGTDRIGKVAEKIGADLYILNFAATRARGEGSATREISFDDRCLEAIPETSW